MKNSFLCRVLNFKIIILCILTINCVKSVYGRHNHLNNNYYKHPRITTNEEANFNIVCPIGDTGLHPYPNNCTRFIECAEGRLYRKDCADKTEFNKKNSICDHKYNLQCDWKYADDLSRHTADILCPKNANGLYSYPFDSCQYINCTNAKTWIQNCHKNTKFSITKRSCIGKDLIDKKDYVKYDLRYHNILAYKYLYKCPHDGEFNHLYPFDARKYVNCQNDKLKVMSCEATLVFSMIEHTCLAQDKVLITERVPFLKELSSERPQHEDELPISNKIYCTMDLFGLYPHLFDNTKYLKCVYGRLYSLSCRKGFVFSLSRKFCDIKEEFPTFDTLPAIQKDYKDESIIQIRTDDNLTYLECPLSLNGSFVYPFDCTKYTKCAQGKTEIFSCPKDHIYSIRKKQCHLGREVNDNDHIECLIAEQDDALNDDFSLGVFCSPIGSSKHPHPRDWHIYVQCHNGKLSVEKCPRNKVFSLKTRQCIKETF